MIQQINLYQIEEPPEATIVTFSRMLQVAVIFIFGLLIISGYKFISYYNIQREFTTLQGKQRSLNLELGHAQDKIPAKEEKEKLIQQIEALEATAARMKKMQLVLIQLQNTNSYGFSAYLAALAKYNVPDLWLTSLKITTGGTLIYLKGKTVNAENVPKLLQKLGVDPVFANKTFTTFKLYTENNDKIVKFTIGSTNE